MKHAILSAVSIAAIASSAFAAELVPNKGPAIVVASAPMWTGFYAGVNAGYGLGTTATTQNSSYNLNDNWAQWESYTSRSSTGCNGKDCTSFNDPNNGISSIANAGISTLTQKGIVGGGQLGYNYNVLNHYVVGLEADFQGSGIQGSGSYTGISSDNYSRSNNGKGHSYLGTRNFVGLGKNDAGLTWLGTARARAGYLITPSLLIYGSGGLAYGNAWSSSKNYSFCSSSTTTNDSGNITFLNTIYPSLSSGGKTELRTGLAAGGGLEWELSPSWTLKAEAIYYNLGTMNYSSSPLVFYGNNEILTASQNATQVSYQGIVARGGLNYHFTLGIN